MSMREELITYKHVRLIVPHCLVRNDDRRYSSLGMTLLVEMRVPSGEPVGLKRTMRRFAAS